MANFIEFFKAWGAQLHETFIVQARYKWLLEGLSNTLVITLGALVIGGTLGYFTAVFIAFYCPKRLKKIFKNYQKKQKKRRKT